MVSLNRNIQKTLYLVKRDQKSKGILQLTIVEK
jgi:hypothetical protein